MYTATNTPPDVWMLRYVRTVKTLMAAGRKRETAICDVILAYRLEEHEIRQLLALV